jgi:hypothetical protein
MAKSKPSMSLLDIFILYLVRDGLKTLYQLKAEAGISIGAASPSLHRLEDQYTYIYRSTTTGRRGKKVVDPRGKIEYEPHIMSALFFQSDSLAPFEADLPTDTESVARLVVLAEAKEKSGLAKKTLKNAIGERQKRVRGAVPVAGRSKIATRYRSIVQACETARLKAEGAALKKILARIK